MDGTENVSMLNRCRMFDEVFRRGPQSIAELSRRLKLRRSEVRRLSDHEWFCGEREMVSLVRLRGPYDEA